MQYSLNASGIGFVITLKYKSMSMDPQKLQQALDHIDANPDISNRAWQRFCEWLSSFHDINIELLLQFETYFEFMRAEDQVPLELDEKIKDLWLKWSKASIS